MLGLLLNIFVKLVPGALPRLVTERPDLLIDHAQAYATLLKFEVDSVRRQWVRRIVASAIAMLAFFAFIVLGGVALMMNATVPIKTGAEWILLAIPLCMLVIALISIGISLPKLRAAPLSLREQLLIDLQAIRAATGSQ
jgi:hypothetical protein